MASEDLFEEDFSEEIISQLDQDYAENVEITADDEDVPNEQEDNDDEHAVAVLTEGTETTATDVNHTEEAAANTEPKATITTTSVANATAPTNNEAAKLFHLPLTRIRNIMKLDPDLNIASNEAVFLVTRATELFIESLSVESYSFTAQAKKKTIQKRDVDLAISAVDSLMFLDGAMTF